jgi:hypothetical protein
LRGKVIIVFLILMMSINSLVFADSASIVLDGSFDDWADKPFVNDTKHDINSTWDDFLEAGYFADKDYLYLRVERLSAHKSEEWHFNVVMLNGLKASEEASTPQFDVLTYYDENKSKDGTIVQVSFEGQVLESTLSSDNNAKMIEFRIPLKVVGLDGANKDIKFQLKSDPADEVIDWLPDGRPIIVTTGPTLYELTTIAAFAFVAFMAYKVVSKKDRKTSLLNK